LRKGGGGEGRFNSFRVWKAEEDTEKPPFVPGKTRIKKSGTYE